MAKMKKAVTMSDIAKRIQVSTVTVSKALSGQKGVSEEVRAQILELAKEMGYKTSRNGGENEKRTSYHIGILIPSNTQGTYDSFYWKMYQEAADSAIQKNCFTSYESLSEEMTKKKILPRLITERVAEGLIVIGRPNNRYGQFLLENAGVPVVFLDFYERDLDVDCFISDSFYGAYFLTEYLIEKGHRDIAYVGTLFATESITDRYLGFYKAMLEHGLTVPEDHIIPDRVIRDGVEENFQEFNLPTKLPTAFVCNCDVTASLLIRHLKQKGMKVPEEVSVVGFDDYLSSVYNEIGITTYAVDIPLMASSAVKSLIHQMDGDVLKKRVHIMEGYLVERDSVRIMEFGK